MAKRVFAICLNNKGYEVSLERWKIYEVIKDLKAETHNMIRIVDESSEDYLYPSNLFEPIDIPRTVEKAMMAEKVA